MLTLEAEIGGPLWVLGQANYALTRRRPRGASLWREGAGQTRRRLDLRSRQTEARLDLPFTSLSSVTLLSPDTARWRSRPLLPKKPPWSELDLRTGQYTVLRAPGTIRASRLRTSQARRPIEFPTDSGPIGHAFFYPPVNAEYSGPTGE